MSDLIERYLACWNETDATTRRTLVDELFTEAATYTDPMAAVRGRDGVDGLIAAVQQQFPGFVFTPGAPLDEHHQHARFGWRLGPAGSEPVVAGFDVVVLDDSGRVRDVFGFLDKVPG